MKPKTLNTLNNSKLTKFKKKVRVMDIKDLVVSTELSIELEHEADFYEMAGTMAFKKDNKLFAFSEGCTWSYHLKDDRGYHLK